MSMHRIPLTKTEEAGLRAHGLDIGTPSQLSDVFRQGVAWGLKAAAELKCPQCEGPADRGLDNCVPQEAYMCSKCCMIEDLVKELAVARLSVNR